MRTLMIIAALFVVTGCAADPNMDNWRAIMATPNYRPATVVMPPIIIYQQPQQRLDAATPGSIYTVPQPNRQAPVNYICPGMHCF